MMISLETKDVKLLIALARRHHVQLAYKLQTQMEEELLFDEACMDMMKSNYNDRDKFLMWHEKLSKKVSSISGRWATWRFIGIKRGHLKPIGKEEQQ